MRIEVENIAFKYPDGHEAINNLSLCIEKGESVGIVGANGAGKSTLLMLLVGIMFPSSGLIRVGTDELNSKTLTGIRSNLGMVFQNPDDQLFMTSVFEDVAFGPRNQKLSEDEVLSRVNVALESVGALHLKTRASHRLSGGEKRAVAIASVLSMNPKVLIMDEPTLALDPKSRRKVISLLNGFNHTKIITSHDLDMILDTCDRVIVMYDGKVIKEGKSELILNDQELMDNCGLEVPLAVQGCPICSKI